MNKQKNFFICFTGIDGSGKTTLAKKTVISLGKNGVECSYVYNRYKPIILRPLIFIGNFLFFNKSDKIYVNYTKHLTSKRKIFNIKILSVFYESILLFDYFFQIFFKIKLPLLLDRKIICDRYIFDTIVTDLAVDLEYSNEKIIRLLDFCFKLFPKPDLIFLIDILEETAFKRKNDVPSIDYLRDRRKIYLKISNKYNMKIINGSNSLDKLEQIVLREISIKNDR